MDMAIVKDVSLLVNAVGVGNCFLLSFAYLQKKENKAQQPGQILSLLFFVLGIVILNTIFNFTGYSQRLYGFEPLSNALCFAIAPLLYLYVKSYRGVKKSISVWSGHLIHFYVYLLITVFTLWIPQSTLGAVGQILMDGNVMRPLWNIHFFCYLIIIAIDFRKIDKELWQPPGILVLGVVSIWFLNLLFYLHNIWIKPLPILIYLNITLLFSGMTLFMFYQKFGITERIGKGSARKRKPNKKNGHYNGNDGIMATIRENKYYRNPNLDIRSLSDELQLPYHELSALINREYGLNFNEFINSFRIQEVVIALRTNQFHSYTIIGLAQKAGFKSASAFYAAFKKEKGTTPTSFLQRVPA